MKLLLFISFFTFTLFTLSAQTLKGKVTDTEGNPIPNATVYIRETAQGIMIDDRGEFQTTLKEGTYTCDFSSLGYERKVLPVTIDKPVISLSVELEKKVYTIKEVVVSAKREDPAYTIMRKAIGMAPFYLHQVETYEAEVYMKGTVKVDKLPRLLKTRINNQELKNITDKLFLVETQTLIKFKAPNNYEENILAFSTTVPFDMEASNPMDIMTMSIYDPDMWGRVSPLSPGAFSYYKFTFEGMTAEGDHLINKIKVQPKKKNNKLVSGWLYIIENSWNVYSADLTGTALGVTVRFMANYHEVKPLAFLPTAYDIKMKVDVMGVKADGKFNASMQYLNATLNKEQTIVSRQEAAPKPVITSKPLTKKQQKAQEKLEKLAEKDELSNRDAYKMSKLMQEVTEPEEVRARRDSLELLPTDANIKVTVDSLAKRRDSLYWADIRDLPLRQEEVESYRQTDTAKIGRNERGENEITLFTPGSDIGRILMGTRFRIKDKYWISYNGLPGIVPEYNFVDGVWLGQRLTFGADFSKSKSLSISPSVYYVTARKAVNWQVDGTFSYAPFRNGKLTVSGGNTTADFNPTGTMRLINSLASLFFAENPIRFYQKKFIEASHRIDVANGLFLRTGFTFEDRNALENNLSYSFFGGKPSPNLPKGHLSPMPDNKATLAKVQVDYTPKLRYWKARDGGKQYSHSTTYPTFSAFYEKGISTGAGSASFDRLEVAINQLIKLNMFNNIYYTVNAGKFLSSERLYFPDFKHFNTSELFITESSLNLNFSLLDNYTYSSDEQWLQAHLNYTTSYLLIKHLPFLQNYLFDEALHARTLWIPGKNHTEFGYSAGLFNVVRVGVFVGLEKGKYDATGFTISLPILKTLGIK